MCYNHAIQQAGRSNEMALMKARHAMSYHRPNGPYNVRRPLHRSHRALFVPE
jgi:hypothetical protein